MEETEKRVHSSKDDLYPDQDGPKLITGSLIDGIDSNKDDAESIDDKVYRKWNLIFVLLDDTKAVFKTIKERAWKLKIAVNDLVSNLIELSLMDEAEKLCSQFCKKTDMFQQLYNWTGQHRQVLKIMSYEQLIYLNNIVSMAGTSLITTKEFVIPMMLLLLSLKPTEKRKVPPDLDTLYVKLLYSISQRISDKHFLDLLAHDNYTSEGFKIPQFTFFELLLLYVHRSCGNGDLARDGILLCIKASKNDDKFLKYIADISSGCVVSLNKYKVFPLSFFLATFTFIQFTT